MLTCSAGVLACRPYGVPPPAIHAKPYISGHFRTKTGEGVSRNDYAPDPIQRFNESPCNDSTPSAPLQPITLQLFNRSKVDKSGHLWTKTGNRVSTFARCNGSTNHDSTASRFNPSTNTK